MPKFHYQAVDAEGRAVSGEIEAAGPEEALGQLEARGLRLEQAGLEQISEPASEPTGGRLSEEEAVEISREVAELAKAGLPLAPGLRALADEMPRRRLTRALRRLARRLDQGSSLEAALEAEGRRFPSHVRGLMLAGVRSGHLVEALEELVNLEVARAELRRQVWHRVAYPCLLLAMLVPLFGCLCAFIVPQFALIYKEFDAALPQLTRAVLWFGGPGGAVFFGGLVCLVAAFLAVVSLRGVAWSRRLLYAVPFIGPVWRWAGLMNLSRLMAVLLGQQVPLPEAFRLTAAGLREGDLALACRGAARQVEAGYSLTESVSQFWQFPPSFRPLVKWAERTSDPAEAFRAGAEMFEGRVRVSLALLEPAFLPLVFLFIIASVAFLVAGLMLPLISLIQNLS
jgi:general secretion pathway protein F